MKNSILKVYISHMITHAKLAPSKGYHIKNLTLETGQFKYHSESLPPQVVPTCEILGSGSWTIVAYA